MPAEDGVGRDDRSDFSEKPATDSLAPDREPTPLIVREPQAPATEWLLQNAVLLSKILDDCVLLTSNPAGHGGDEDLPGVKDRGHPFMMPNPEDNRQLFRAFETG